MQEEIKEKILLYLQKVNKKQDFLTLKKKLGISKEDEVRYLEELLKELEISGDIYLDEKGFYQLFNVNALERVQGELYISRKGNGYVTVKDKDGKEFNYMIYRENLNGAISGDIVVLNDFNHKKYDYINAKVEKIVKRNHNKIVFEYFGNGVFLPYNQKTKLTFALDKKECENYVVGDRVLALVEEENLGKIMDTPVFNGQIITLIGHKDDPKIDIETIAYDYGFSTKFSEEALSELDNIPFSVSEKEKQGRRDLTDKLIFTIDGADTKDIDDAISIEKDGENYILGVHIADVSHYVKPKTALFKEAKMRATSAYLIDSVIPMLPHKLSNGICSLNPEETRLAVSCAMKIDKDGKLIDYDIFKSVIKSKKQMTYENVNKILKQDVVPEGYEEYVPALKMMAELSEKILEKAKIKRGSIDFDGKELKIKTDKFGKPIKLMKRTQDSAEKIIENFMLMANETIATHFSYMSVPFVYRIHESPDLEKFTEIMEFIKSQDLYDVKKINRLLEKANNNNLHSYDIAKLLRDLKDMPYYMVVSDMILRSMSRARYTKENAGHYGLALENYTHFTSPIRRFPDLMVHTLINEYETFSRLEEIEQKLEPLCEHASYMERQADDAEKAANELKMAEYMENHIGEIYEGMVVNCTRYGLVVILDNLVKGRANFEDIVDGDYYFGENSHQLIDRNNQHNKYKIGDKVFVKVKAVSVPYRTIDFMVNKENKFSRPKIKKYHK